MECKCPSCGSLLVKKNGDIHNGKQNHYCLSCGRQFVLNPQQKIIDDQTKALVRKALHTTIPEDRFLYNEMIQQFIKWEFILSTGKELNVFEPSDDETYQFSKKAVYFFLYHTGIIDRK